MTHISSLANETLLLICRFLDDTDLLVLCQTSGRFNHLALQVFFFHHGICSHDIESGTISATSSSLPGIRLALAISTLNKLSCTFNHATAESDISALTHFVSRHPRIGMVEVNIDQIPSEDMLRSVPIEHFFDLLLTLISAERSTLLILMHGYIKLSRRRRIYPDLRDLGIFRSRSISILNCCAVAISIGFLVLLQELLTVIRDPFACKHQADRIRRDLNSRFSPASLCITRHFIPSPRFSNWTLVAIDQSTLTSLRIPAIPDLRSEWAAILSNLTLPSLTSLNISNNAQLPFPSFSSFLARHPSLISLTLEYFSATYTDLAPLPTNALSHLRYLIASPRHILNILGASLSAAGDGAWRDMITVGFPPGTQLVKATFGWIPDPSARYESPFNFAEFDEALHAVAELDARLTDELLLQIQIPGGTKSRRWFRAVMEGYEERVERRMHHVSFVHLRTEKCRSLDLELLTLLPRWLGLFPNVRQVTIAQWVAPTHALLDRLVVDVFESCPNVQALQDVELAYPGTLQVA